MPIDLTDLTASLRGVNCSSFTNRYLLGALRLELDLLRYSAPLELTDVVSWYQEIAMRPVTIPPRPNASVYAGQFDHSAVM